MSWFSRRRRVELATISYFHSYGAQCWALCTYEAQREALVLAEAPSKATAATEADERAMGWADASPGDGREDGDGGGIAGYGADEASFQSQVEQSAGSACSDRGSSGTALCLLNICNDRQWHLWWHCTFAVSLPLMRCLIR